MLHTKLKGAKFLRIIFDKVDGNIRKFGGTKYPELFHSNKKYDRIFDRIRYLITLKSNKAIFERFILINIRKYKLFH